ncbi:MAG: TlpA family protein disulfide reductase [Proteobacteria bacterium]|nr:TlpA family protein disulfide reductase [Pseudomonadota bacterium]
MLPATRTRTSFLLVAALGMACPAIAQVKSTPNTGGETVAVPTAPAKGATVPAMPLLVKKGDGAAAAPKTPDTIDPKAKALHDKCLDTVKKLKGIDMVTDMKFEGMDPAMLPPGIGGMNHVILDFKSDGGPAPFGRFVLEGMKDGKQVSRFAYNGTGSVMVDDSAKTFTEGGKEWFQLLGQRAANLPQWHIESRMDLAALGAPPEQIPQLVGLSVVGTEKLDGVDCDVIQVVRTLKLEGMEDENGNPAAAKEMRITETIAIAKTDSLPRRVASKTEVPGDEAMGAMNSTALFTAVKLDPAMDEKTFSTAAPAGYKKAEASDADDEAQGPALKVKAGDAAPEFALKDTEGKEVTLASLKGKVVLLDFWATWCGPCKAAMPTIQKLHEAYKDKGVVILGVNTWEKNADAAKDYMAKKKFTYGCLMNGDDLAKAYGVVGIPTLVIIGKDGKVAMADMGLSDDTGASLRKVIDAALAK